VKIKEVIKILEDVAPLGMQESYDNSGLNIGNPNNDISGVLCTIDLTEEVLDECIQLGANLIVAHHPLIFGGLKSITGKGYIERIVIKAIKKDIAIYAGHTNFDNIPGGVNAMICTKIGLEDCSILAPIKDQLLKLVTFAPQEQASKIREALFSAGAGKIGNYDQCSFHLEGTGSFRGSENTTPFVGKKEEIHFEKEVRIEVILPTYLKNKVVSNLIQAHPYEEVAYDLYPLANENPFAGAGMIGKLNNEITIHDFLSQLKKTFNADGIRYTGNPKKKISTVAVCGGSGSFLINKAKAKRADVFVTGDLKYHQFFDADDRLSLIDIGHFESEQFTKDVFYESVMKKIPKFAVHLSKVTTSPIKYYK